MKTNHIYHAFLLLLLASALSAQQGINYKAIIHDDSGDPLSNTLITIQFTILENGTTNVYQESHNPTTDDNGIIIANIGEGTPISGDFFTIDWGSNPHYLKTEIDIGGGLTDMGTTEFKAVPYSLYSETASMADNAVETQTLAQVLFLGNDAGTQRIVNLADPVEDQDAASKLYVDQLESRVVDLENLVDNLINADNDSDGYTINEGDCDECDPLINPGSPDLCDGIDNDCDGQIDENGVCVPCSADIVFALDGSASMDPNEASSIKTSLKSAFQEWSTSKPDLHVTIFGISDEYDGPYLIHGRVRVADGLSTLSTALDDWEPNSQFNCFPYALPIVYYQLASMGDPGSPKVVVLITDNDNPNCLSGEMSKDNVIFEVADGFDLGIRTMAIGWYDEVYLNGIAEAGHTEPALVTSDPYLFFDDYLIEFDYCLDCPAGMAECYGECIDILTDVNNCGGCNQDCFYYNADYECIDGQCIMGLCNPPYYDLDTDPSNGCECEISIPANTSFLTAESRGTISDTGGEITVQGLFPLDYSVFFSIRVTDDEGEYMPIFTVNGNPNLQYYFTVYNQDQEEIYSGSELNSLIIDVETAFDDTETYYVEVSWDPNVSTHICDFFTFTVGIFDPSR